MLHHIQRTIVNKLGSTQSARYGELKPAELDGNVFGYHLKQLVATHLVAKDLDSNYSLTTSGREYFIRRNEDPLRSAHSILLMVIRCDNYYLLRERLVQPLIGRVGFIHGEPIAGEPVEQTATRRVREKTGLTIDFKVRTTALISQSHDANQLSYSHAIILYGETNEKVQIAEDETGCNLLQEDLREPHILPSCADVVDMIQNGTSWAELSYEL